MQKKVGLFLLLGIVISIFTSVFLLNINAQKEYRGNSKLDKVTATGESKEMYAPTDERTYRNVEDFPYEDMNFVEYDIFEFIINEYQKINFGGEYKPGNLEEYDFYKDIYRQFIENKIPFTDLQTKEEIYLKQFSPVCLWNGAEKIYDAEKYIYYFFDMDGDEAPELCINYVNGKTAYFTYIFKYVSELEKVILWKDIYLSSDSIGGSNTIFWDCDGAYFGMYKLNEDGKEVMSIAFFSDVLLDDGEVVYMLSLPHYYDNDNLVKITEEIRQQSYYDESTEQYYFRVTESQYNEATKDYFDARTSGVKNLVNVTYTYDELFGAKE